MSKQLNAYYIVTVPGSLRNHPEVEAAIVAAVKEFGGCTETSAFGSWYDGEKLVSEPVHRLQFNRADGVSWNAFQGNEKALLSLVNIMLDLGEIEVFLERYHYGEYTAQCIGRHQSF